MEQNQIIINAIVVTVVAIGFLLIFVRTYRKNKEYRKQESTVEQPVYETRYPKYRGSTTDPTECYHHKAKAQYHIMLDPPNGVAMTWAHEEMNAYDSLLNAFTFDRKNNIEIFTLETQERFLAVAKKFDTDGWPAWGKEEDSSKEVINNPVVDKIQKDLGDKHFKQEYPMTPEESFKAIYSSCCKIPTSKPEMGAAKCPRCNKYCKLIDKA